MFIRHTSPFAGAENKKPPRRLGTIKLASLFMEPLTVVRYRSRCLSLAQIVPLCGFGFGCSVGGFGSLILDVEIS
jgi:hypothetical protein